MREQVKVVFFDIGDTLGSVRLSPSRDRIERIEVFPEVPRVLRELNERPPTRLGIISNRGRVSEEDVKRALAECGLLDSFDPNLIIFGPKDSTEIFKRAASQADLADAPQECLFVGESVDERDFASQAGMKTAASPREALEVSR